MVEYWHPECGPHECTVREYGEEESCIPDLIDEYTWQLFRNSTVFQDEDKNATYAYWENFHNHNVVENWELYEWIFEVDETETEEYDWEAEEWDDYEWDDEDWADYEWDD